MKMKSRQIVIYTRQGCCLCDQAEALLVRHWLRPRLVDIDQDADLREQFNDCVPVVEIDGHERFGEPLHALDAARFAARADRLGIVAVVTLEDDVTQLAWLPMDRDVGVREQGAEVGRAVGRLVSGQGACYDDVGAVLGVH